LGDLFDTATNSLILLARSAFEHDIHATYHIQTQNHAIIKI